MALIFEEQSFIVVGTVRNCDVHLDEAIGRIAGALKGAKSIDWLLIESDSQDETLAKLAEAGRQQPGFRFLSAGHLSEDRPKRTDRLAFCRNLYCRDIATSDRYPCDALVLVADFDGINQLLSREAIQSCFARDDWDVCAANQLGPYYDLWALRHPEWCPGDVMRQVKYLKQYGIPQFKLLEVLAVTLPPTAPWIEVQSAFGGSAIYKKWVFDHAKYVGLDDEGNEICEHVAFHADIRSQGGRVFINPAFINAGITEHTTKMMDRRTKPDQTEKGTRARPAYRRFPERVFKEMLALTLGSTRAKKVGDTRKDKRKRATLLKNQSHNKLETTDRAHIFSEIYRTKHWGTAQDSKDGFYSGTGSHDPTIVGPYVDAIGHYLAAMPEKLALVDLGCGDFNVGSRLCQFGSHYIACDIVEPLISRNKLKYAALDAEFRVLDCVRDELPAGDVVFLRQVLQHLSNADIEKVVQKIAASYRYLILTEHVPDTEFIPNLDIRTGEFRLNLQSAVVPTVAPFYMKAKSERELCRVPESGGYIVTMAYLLA